TTKLGTWLAILGLSLLWLWIWPYTGEGDSVLHYLCARTVPADPTVMLSSWARPLHKLLILVPALGGIVPARICQALLTLAMSWQTVLLAGQLRLRNAILAAPLVFAQPYVFALASDTMTEIPMALALVIALRLWISGRLGWSCLVASLLPLLRPEGFFLIALWGLMLLLPRLPDVAGGNSLLHAGHFKMPETGARRHPEVLRRILPLRESGQDPSEYLRMTRPSVRENGQRHAAGELGGRHPAWPGWRSIFRRRMMPAALLFAGLLAWMLACWIVAHDALYFIRIWSWPMDSYSSYHPGPIYHYIVLWPVYCGVVLIVPFVAGIWPTLSAPKMRLIWIIWLLVFVLHSLLYWLHKFASVGLLRILACTAPMTALICLEGFNAIGGWLANRGIGPVSRRRYAIATVLLAMLWAMFFYLPFGEHYHCFGYRRLVREIDARHFLDAYRRQQASSDPHAPRLIAGDKMFLATLGLNADPPHYLAYAMDGPSQAARMSAAPIGSVGTWDSEQATAWNALSIDQLPALGYTIVYEFDQTVWDWRGCLDRGSIFSRQRYVLVRKDFVPQLSSAGRVYPDDGKVRH
ncbi:MAG TPA: hypothetical protein VFE47_25485, partial [Tepidisphaeraceae bacterium]|nr:hypothetical protein [Tepidisphaeraceae bacterium]